MRSRAMGDTAAPRRRALVAARSGTRLNREFGAGVISGREVRAAILRPRTGRDHRVRRYCRLRYASASELRAAFAGFLPDGARSPLAEFAAAEAERYSAADARRRAAEAMRAEVAVRRFQEARAAAARRERWLKPHRERVARLTAWAVATGWTLRVHESRGFDEAPAPALLDVRALTSAPHGPTAAGVMPAAA